MGLSLEKLDPHWLSLPKVQWPKVRESSRHKGWVFLYAINKMNWTVQQCWDLFLGVEQRVHLANKVTTAPKSLFLYSGFLVVWEQENLAFALNSMSTPAKEDDSDSETYCFKIPTNQRVVFFFLTPSVLPFSPQQQIDSSKYILIDQETEVVFFNLESRRTGNIGDNYLEAGICIHSFALNKIGLPTLPTLKAWVKCCFL